MYLPFSIVIILSVYFILINYVAYSKEEFWIKILKPVIPGFFIILMLFSLYFNALHAKDFKSFKEYGDTCISTLYNYKKLSSEQILKVCYDEPFGPNALKNTISLIEKWKINIFEPSFRKQFYKRIR